jgi:hypothetical protein
MATFLDVSFLGKFSKFFVFLLVLVMFYGILEKGKFFGENKQGLNALIAFLAGLMVLLSPKITAIFKTIFPMFFLITLVGVLGAIGYKIFVGEEMTILTKGPNGALTQTINVVIFIIIVIMSIYAANMKTNTIDENGNIVAKNYTDLDQKANDTELDVNYKTGVFNPNLMGMIIVLIIGVLIVKLLASNSGGSAGGGHGGGGHGGH